ncbi:MAG: phenylalanine--tRNA ligase subunit beta [Anaerolineales bacterium]|uniref:phenylalanine--tRNA ligase subunit beta n=1 Tax=Candidatus Villigracilis vicinus TaxID=3140679 RepID=UPI003134FB60|nr:phenylalanine--tRNA ligase subunit beta [Anaerolineales bacterium]
MKIPLSWLKDFIDLDGLSVEDIARKLTLAGMEVDEILYVGLPMPVYKEGEKHEFKTNGIGWDKEKLVVAEIREVKAHPNADKLTLLDLYDGQQDQVVLTGAPNIFHLKGTGKLEKPIKVAYAKEGTTLYDGHAEGQVLMTLKRAKIRGVDSYSMVCSEKELGITEESDGIIILDDDAPVGMPLADYIGDAVLDISILPNMARNANVVGIARELAAMLGRDLRVTNNQLPKASGQSVKELVEIEIGDPELNPRFVVGLIRNIEIKPSPYQIQRRLKLAGVRAISNIVDATNYAMLEYGEPLHAFDYDVLKQRAGNKKIKIITRAAKDGEKLKTLDGNERTLTPMNVLVCDEKGSLSLAGVMGGAESEVSDTTKNILLEGAAWNFINIRRTAKQHNLPSEASFRFSRGVHPAMAEGGVSLGLKYMAEWAGGAIAPDLVDAYPLPPKDAVVEITVNDVKRWLGIDLTLEEISNLLSRLEFKSTITNNQLQVTSPNHRMDIGEGVVGVADVLEEVARSYGYDNIPTTTMADALPPQVGNPIHEWEEHLRDLLVALGLQEVVSYRMTSPEKEGRIAKHDEYVRLANPIAPEKSVLRRSLVASVIDSLEKNIRYSEAFSFFEIGSVFVPHKNELPDEPRKLAIAMTGLREATAWDVKDSPALDFFDLKGRIELMLSGLRLTNITYTATDSYSHLHPGKAAEVKAGDKVIGAFGEMHPLVKEQYELGDSPVLVAEFDLDIMRAISPTYGIKTIPETPPIYEDIALIVDESVKAETVEALIRQTGGRSVTNVRLFDLYRDEKIGEGKKSLAYALTYQAEDKTMTDADAAAIRNKIVKRLEKEVGAKLRS